jgi:hypothetical protein
MATDYADESDLQYIDGLEEIPLTGPDAFSTEQKLEAAEMAEAKLEADVNLGEALADPTTLHRKAATAWASYLLFAGGDSPTDALSGQMVEGSMSDAMEFAKELENIYNSTIASIRTSEAGSDDDDLVESSFFVPDV